MTKKLLLALFLLTATLTAQPTDRPLLYAEAGPALIAGDWALGASADCRYFLGRNGIDLSAAYYEGRISRGYILPSLRYIRLVPLSEKQSLHLGLGASYGDYWIFLWGFRGLLAHASLGYDLEWGRCHVLLSADYHQPAIDTSDSTSYFFRTYDPIFSLKLGIGF